LVQCANAGVIPDSLGAAILLLIAAPIASLLLQLVRLAWM
jgi:hypothetical protein